MKKGVVNRQGRKPSGQTVGVSIGFEKLAKLGEAAAREGMRFAEHALETAAGKAKTYLAAYAGEQILAGILKERCALLVKAGYTPEEAKRMVLEKIGEQLGNGTPREKRGDA